MAMAAVSLTYSSSYLLFSKKSQAHKTKLELKPCRPWLNPQQRSARTRLQRGYLSKRLHCMMKPGDEVPLTQSNPLPSSLSDLITDFYLSINEKDMSRLHNLIADDSVFEDSAFSKPLQGKQVHHFLEALAEAMGKHVQFSIDHVCVDGGLLVGVIWHLEWNKERIPFTKGCSFFECSRNGERLLIKSASIFVEYPVKPGELVLELLKIISKLFDKYPNAAEKFLQKPDAMIEFMARLYKIWVEPFFLRVQLYYTYARKFAAWVISYVLNLLQNLFKFRM